ncbi:hypothetical protein [Roseovarius sp. ZX-A-9]|uniref:hypothetical protein n=1 Tax=Roseovarius sp. ZX-A-9 TaxID=3014783 RepID=UPI00232AEBFA|nr:hypothetical protein [Roseovarius sp. ZX-A-9]
MNTQAIVAIVITAILMAASALGLTETLGAHPLWAVKTGMIGSGAGLLAYAGLRWAGMRSGPVAILGGLTLVSSGFVATQGKSVFIVSFSENTLAGRFWFFGWFAVMGALCLTLCALTALTLRR